MSRGDRRTWVRAIGVVLTATAVLPAHVGCASWVATRSRAWLESWRGGAEPGPAGVELDSVPFFPQTPFHCGPAALAAAMTHAGMASDPDELAASVFVPALEGTLQVEMLAAPRTRGALAVRIPGELPALRRELLAGRPVVVLQNLGFSWRPLWHYAVVVGVDLDRAEIILRSGTTRRELMPLPTFDLTWSRSDSWALVVVKPGAWPETATRTAAEEAAVGFERVAKPLDILRTYDGLLVRWPESFTAAMGQGNALLTLARPSEAARVFERAAADHDRAAAWNNLAVARARAGDRSGALDAAQRALVVARDREPGLRAAVDDTASRLRSGGVP